MAAYKDTKDTNPATPGVETKVLSPGHDDDHKSGKVTEVISHIEPTVPSPPGPLTAIGVDPSHGASVDTYANEGTAALAPGIHLDLADISKPVGVITHNPPPFHRVDGAEAGANLSTSEGVELAKSNSGKGGNPAAQK